MKKLVLMFCLLCGVLLGGVTQPARAFDFSLNGQNYSFSTVHGFSANQALLTSQVWWGNDGLLSTFVSAVNNTAPNNTLFASAYALDSSWSGGAYVNYQANSYCCGPQGSGALNINSANASNFAVVTLLVPPPPPGPSAADTQVSLQGSAMKLGGVFGAAASGSNFANMNTYDCDVFDAKGMCISVGGRYTGTTGPGTENTSAVVVLGYQATPHIRIGGFLDKSINNDAPAGIHISTRNPLGGVFGIWNQRANTTGVQVKLANAYQARDVSITRDTFGSSQAGTGNTSLTTQSYVGELSYAFTWGARSLVRPYLALRHTNIALAGYTETGVSMPLTYAQLNDRATTALLGVKWKQMLTARATLTASAGLEQDLRHHIDNFSASGIGGLTSVNVNDSIRKTRPVESLGLTYALTPTQKIAFDVLRQELPFQGSSATTVYLNYMVGI